jgi:mRNA interferase MazF
MVKRGEIWWADFGTPLGSEPGFVRPAIVVSSDRFNRSRLRTVIVAPVTSNLSRAAHAGTMRLPLGLLDRPSLVLAHRLRVVDRSRLIQHAAELPTPERQELDQCLRLVFDL